MWEDFSKGLVGVLIAGFATGVGWIISKVVGMDSKFATKHELTQLGKEMKEDMKDLKEQVAELAILPTVLARVEREIGTHETGLRGAIHRLTSEVGGVLRKIQSDIDIIKDEKRTRYEETVRRTWNQTDRWGGVSSGDAFSTGPGAAEGDPGRSGSGDLCGGSGVDDDSERKAERG